MTRTKRPPRICYYPGAPARRDLDRVIYPGETASSAIDRSLRVHRLVLWLARRGSARAGEVLAELERADAEERAAAAAEIGR